MLKTAQGSSTVAIITTSSIMFPLLPLLNLDSDLGKVWVIMALGVGSMTMWAIYITKEINISAEKALQWGLLTGLT